MKPWYDNYCFSKDALEKQSKVFNCDMVLYYLRNYMSNGRGPEEMIDPNVKVSLKGLFPHDKYESFRKDTILKLMQKGEVASSLHEPYSIYELLKPELLASLLFYKGVLTIKGIRGNLVVLAFANKCVSKLYKDELLEFVNPKV